ncbi:MAG TPA: hypothetical protein VGM44_13425 [Polyangiaceae bacterium]|jgi:hypothetical protein
MQIRSRFTLALTFAALATSARAFAEEPSEKAPAAGAQAPGFFCLGEAGSLLRSSTVEEMRFERDLRLKQLRERKVPPSLLAHTHCVVAQLMSKLGDSRAASEYEAAIAANPNEPAYELWYGRYYHWFRGASSPLSEQAEDHYYRALDKLETYHGRTNVGSTDATAREWSERNLALLYQEDGVPLFPLNWKAYPYDRNATWAPQLTLSLVGSYARDTTDFWEATDTRRFTQELQTAVDRREAGGPRVSENEIKSIARASERWDTQARLRLRQRLIGVLDVTYRRAKLLNSQITDGAEPLAKNDVSLEEAGLHARREFDLYPLFDLMLDAGYALQKRTGVVEDYPDLLENVKIAQVNAAASRFIGPDKLTIGGTYVHFGIPSSPGGGPEAERSRVIRAAFIDYAIYRPLLIPQIQKGTFMPERTSTRGWHWFLAGALDDEQFGRSVLHKATYSGGTAFKGWLDYNLTLVGSYISSGLESNGILTPNQRNAQWRSEIVVARRLIDEEANPGLPGPLASMQMVVDVRHDLAVSGLTEFENFRVGAALWSKIFSEGLRGSSFLIDVGADYQYFYNIDKALVSARIEARLGWPSFGNIPAFF